MLGAGPDHIAVIDAAPLSTFHHGELHPAQPVSGNVVALVGLPRLLRVDELTASPRPATLKDSLAPQSTLTGNVIALVGLLRILRDSEQSVSPRPATHRDRLARRRAGRRRRSRPPKSVSRRQQRRSPAPTEKHIERRPVAEPAENTRSARESTSDFPPHGALGGFALATATLVASTPTGTSSVGRLGDGGTTKRRGEAVSVEESVPVIIGVGRGLRGTGGLRGRCRGCRRPGDVDRRRRAD